MGVVDKFQWQWHGLTWCYQLAGRLSCRIWRANQATTRLKKTTFFFEI